MWEFVNKAFFSPKFAVWFVNLTKVSMVEKLFLKLESKSIFFGQLSFFSFFLLLNSVYLPHHYSLPFGPFLPLHFTVTMYLQFSFQTIYSSFIFILPVKPIHSVAYSASMSTCFCADLYAWKYF